MLELIVVVLVAALVGLGLGIGVGSILEDEDNMRWLRKRGE